MYRLTVTAALAATASAQTPSPALSLYSAAPSSACLWCHYTEGEDWAFFLKSGSSPSDCANACEAADSCTGFEMGPAITSSGADSSSDDLYCAFWYGDACSAEEDRVVADERVVTYSRMKIDKTGVVAQKEGELGKVYQQQEEQQAENKPKSTTTVSPAVMGDGLYVLKYSQQACAWSDFVQGEDWQMYLTGTNDATVCAAGCVASSDCTGFEVGNDAGSEFGNGPYCAFWLNNACTVPYLNYAQSISVFGETVQVDTYTLTEPIDAFAEYENQACGWNEFIEGEDWEFASKDGDDASACAQICLDRSSTENGGCTGFEVGSSTQPMYGDLSNGYCALWYNSSCAPYDFLPQYTQASTYLLLTEYEGCYSHHFFYIALFIVSFMFTVGLCCCCRRAIIRRRTALGRALAAARRARVAVRAAEGAVPSATVAVEGQTSRAVVYAVRIAEVQEEPEKL